MALTAIPPAVRFARHYYVADNGCWIWTGQRNTQGYGLWNATKGNKWRAHRWSYTQKYGPIPPGLVLDHYVCNETSCVNPDHVRPVTQQENALRGNGVAAKNAAKTHCKRGHELPVYIGNPRGACQVCIKELSRLRKRVRRSRSQQTVDNSGVRCAS